MRRVRKTGSVMLDRIGGDRRRVLEPHQDLLRSLGEAKSGITLAEIQVADLGDRIVAMVAAAKMDPEANPHPEKLDLARRPNRHQSFGAWIHFCSVTSSPVSRVSAR